MNTLNSRKLTARDYKSSPRGTLDLGRWREFGIGLGVGLLIALIVYISDHRAGGADSEEHAAARVASADGAATPAADKAGAPVVAAASPDAEEGQDYQFYEKLRDYEVVIPQKDATKKPAATTGQITQPGTYFVQAGAFTAQADADRVRVQLDKQGISALVQRVAIDNDVRFRVRIGPLRDLAQLNKIRAQLQASDFASIPIRVSD